MGCRKISRIVTLIAAFVFVLGANALAIETTCIFNEETQQIEYSISEGEVGVDYIIHVTPSLGGCLTVDGTPPGITGPIGSASVGFICGGEGKSTVTVEICKDVLCFAIYELNFHCPEDCSNIRQIRAGVPTMTYWGIAGLILLLIGSAVVVYRRKTVIN